MLDELTRHQIYLQRYSKGIYNKEIEPILIEARKQIFERMINADDEDYIKLSFLLGDINQIIDKNIKELSPDGLFGAFAEYEAIFTNSMLNNAVNVAITGISKEQIESSVKNLVVELNGEILNTNQMFAQFSERFKKDVATKIRAGIVNGLETIDIAVEVKKMVTNRTFNQAQAIILTVANAVGDNARHEVFKNNQNLFNGEEYVATLDSRTTIRCASLDGKIFAFNEGPRPPQHYRCRSVRVPIIKPEYDLIPDKERASKDGAIPAKTTYSEWLKKQPHAVQDEVLGFERAKLFREGKFTLEQFVDYTGRTYTLNELKIADKIL